MVAMAVEKHVKKQAGRLFDEGEGGRAFCYK
jgi:hypothetical protein